MRELMKNVYFLTPISMLVLSDLRGQGSNSLLLNSQYNL